jgi:hypothetical protein
VSVVRVLAHADIGHHHEVWQRPLQLANRVLHRPTRIPRAGADFILSIRNSEQQHTADAERRGGLRIAQHLVDRGLRHTRHRSHCLPDPLPRAHEQR